MEPRECGAGVSTTILRTEISSLQNESKPESSDTDDATEARNHAAFAPCNSVVWAVSAHPRRELEPASIYYGASRRGASRKEVVQNG